MSKKKKIIVTLVTILVIAALIAGGIFAYLWHQKNNLTAEVYYVSDLSWYYGGSEMTSYGMVTNDFYQDVYLVDGQTVSEVYVEEGQEVKAGDYLLAYDMTLTNLQLEMQQLEVENLKNRLILANRELEKLKQETPIPEQETVPEPPPVEETETPQIDPATGAYNYISMSTDTAVAATAGTGTPDDPYVILCMPGCYVEGGYLNSLVANETLLCVRLQVINPANNTADTEKYWALNNQQLEATGMTFEDASRWSVETKMPVAEEEPEDDMEAELPVEPMEPQGYTAKELAAAIKSAEKNIKDLDLQKRKAELQLEQMQKVNEDGVVTATVDGIVKTVGDKDNPPIDGSPFITVSGSDGLYVSGSLSELQLGEVTIGQIIYANSWESGMSFEATIQEISPYPTDNNNSWGEGNPNVSYYPYVAYIANPEGLRNGEYVDLTMTAMYSSEDMSAIYLQKAYVREEDGRNYVLIADENDRLKKQYVETGKTIYGEAVEIISGLTMEDRIAFPYGKTAKEGIRVEDISDSMYYY